MAVGRGTELKTGEGGTKGWRKGVSRSVETKEETREREGVNRHR